VEFLTGLVFALGGYRFGLSPMLGFFIVASGFFIVIAVYDYKHLLILDKVVLPGAILAFLFNLGLDLTGSCQAAASAWWRSCTVSGIEGALLIAGFSFLQHMLSKGRWIGFGDVKLGLLLGLAVGFAGSLVLLFIAYLLGAITGLGLIAAGRKHLSSRLPFGTFLSVSAIITLLYGEPILDWYLTLIGFR
jgi:leader peptidase (prepilin peptidase)/N-methyltransferase